MSTAVWAILATVAVSLIPALELRAGIPVGLALGLPTVVAVATAIFGNLLQIPVALATVAAVYRYGARLPRLAAWLAKTQGQMGRHQSLVRRWGWLGLAAFVLLPLPGTGVWGGVVLARLLLFPSIGIWSGLMLGVTLSGTVLGAGIHGTLSVLQWFGLVGP